MKKIGLIFLSLLVVGAVWYRDGRAQTVVPPITMQSTVAHTACAVPPAGTSAYCFASDGLWQSINGAAYVQLTPAASGVSSITVCNAAGAQCGSPQTGGVLLSIPKAASTTLQ